MLKLLTIVLNVLNNSNYKKLSLNDNWDLDSPLSTPDKS